jgi:Lrp/AsnC family transcriptional regulator for asnA, asnC and gidA
MKGENFEIDKLDLQILSILIEDGRTPYTDIAKKLFVSGGTIHVRMKKMEKQGIALKQQLKVDYEKLGFDVTSFVGVYMNQSSEFSQVLGGLKEIKEIVESHYTTGTYGLFLKLVCRDTNHLRDVLGQIQQIKGIQRTETLISLEESINRPMQLISQVDE